MKDDDFMLTTKPSIVSVLEKFPILLINELLD